MAIENCINEFNVDDVIFEEGSTGRDLFVVLDGKIEIAKLNGANKTVIVTLGQDRDRALAHIVVGHTAQLFDALDARSNFEPIMQSVRALNKLDDN